MFEWTVNNRRLVVRNVESIGEFHEVEDIQREAWQFSDLDVVPAATMIATGHAGGLLLGAFDEERMIGFAYGFPAFENGRISIHSHMLAVRPDYRNFQAGFFLKLAQRQAALERGIDEITWTYDPLQTLNAHLNFSKLGVIARRYLVNFYGEETSSPLHRGFGTDRLWVNWILDSEPVKQRIAQEESTIRPNSSQTDPKPGDPQATLVSREGNLPATHSLSSFSSTGVCYIEIPRGINELKEKDPEIGRAWREATRNAFLSALEQGFTVEDFVHTRDDPPRWYYVLRR